MDGETNLAHFDRLLAPIDNWDLIVLPEMLPPILPWKGSGPVKYPARNARSSAISAIRCGGAGAMVGGSAAITTLTSVVNRFLLVQPDGVTYRYDKRHLFRMLDEHRYYQAGQERVLVDWHGWRILSQVCYDLRFPLWSLNQHYDLALYVAN